MRLVCALVCALAYAAVYRTEAVRIAQPCHDATAYVGLLSVHNSSAHSTSLATDLAKAQEAGDAHALQRALSRQLAMLVVLLRSLRAVEECRRDFVLIGALPDLPSVWQSELGELGVKLHPTPALVPGSPATDKLQAWRLTQYRRVLVLDSDVMALRSVSSLFADSAPIVAAHHESDIVQSRCGVPLEKRLIGALYAISPSEQTFRSIVSTLPRFTPEKDMWKRYAEQQVLACHFGRAAVVLPCSFLFNINNPASTACRSHIGPRTPEECLGSYHKLCVRWGGKHVTNHGAQCDAVVRHAREHCQWSRRGAERDTRMIHFKGKQKPWAQATGACKPLRLGSLRVGTHENVTVRQATRELGGDRVAALDEYALEWSNERRTCLVGGGREQVLWASGKPLRVKRCCALIGAMAARWYSFAPRHWVRAA